MTSRASSQRPGGGQRFGQVLRNRRAPGWERARPSCLARPRPARPDWSGAVVVTPAFQRVGDQRHRRAARAARSRCARRSRARRGERGNDVVTLARAEHRGQPDLALRSGTPGRRAGAPRASISSAARFASSSRFWCFSDLQSWPKISARSRVGLLARRSAACRSSAGPEGAGPPGGIPRAVAAATRAG